MTTPSLRRTVATKAIELPQGYAAVEDLMRLLVKAVRAQQLYAANNPMHRTAIEALRAGFATVWVEQAELTLTVLETELHWSGFPVLADPARSSDNLAWLFYKDGIRELKFARGVEDTEIIRLLDIIGRARKATVDDDDLITMLWEADLGGLTYNYMDLGGEDSEQREVRDGRPTPEEVSPEEIHLGIEQAAGQAKIRGVVNMADFDQTLHFLDEREIDYLTKEIAREYEQDLRINIVATLLDIFEQQNTDAVREEVLDYVETMLAFLLASGNFRGVAYLLAELKVAVERPGDASPAIMKRVASIPDRLSAPEALEQMLEALDSAPSLPPFEELALLFEQLRPGALGTIFSWISKVRADQLRALIVEVADRLAEAHPAELVKLIESADADASNEAIRRAGAMKSQAAVASLGKVLADPDAKRRFITVQALADIGSAGALQSLERALSDTERDVRIIAMRSIGGAVHRPALAKIDTLVRGKEIRDADVTEKTALFDCFGAVAGDGGVQYLDSILNGKGFLGKREDNSMRAAAAVGLGRIASAKAREALQRASVDKEPVVRNAVARALRGATT